MTASACPSRGVRAIVRSFSDVHVATPTNQRPRGTTPGGPLELGQRLRSASVTAQTWGEPWSPVPGRLPDRGECHLWPVRLSTAAVDLTLLDADEKEQAERFQIETAHRTFVASRTLQYQIGAHYLGRDLQDVLINRTCEHCGGGHGRPSFANSALDFSVSHSGEWLLVAVVGEGRVGADIEHSVNVPADLDDIAHMVMTPSEWEAYETLPLLERSKWFFRIWVRKEATVKLTGNGLVVQLPAIDVQGMTPSTNVPVDGWPSRPIYLHDVQPPSNHMVALATSTRISVLRACSRGQLF